MEHRKCKKCGEVKPITEFYKHGKYYATQCKECARAYSRKYTAEHCEERIAYRKKYYSEHKEEINRHNKEWIDANREKHNAYRRKYIREHMDELVDYQKKSRSEHPEKYRANAIINSRIKRGKLTRPTACEVCGKEGRVEAHHDDYSKPLEVVWCCKSCHWKLDEERREKERA